MSELERLQRASEPFVTIEEIVQQPILWEKTAQTILRMHEQIASFLSSPGALVLTGAGSSEFVGRSIESALRKSLNREVNTVPTTHLVTHCSEVFLSGEDYLLISFARSGNSPESVATFQRTLEQFPRVRQAVITCNENGRLAQLAASVPGSLRNSSAEGNERQVARHDELFFLYGACGTLAGARGRAGRVCANRGKSCPRREADYRLP